MGFYSSIFRYHNNNNIVFVMFLQRATPRFTKKGQVHPYLDATALCVSLMTEGCGGSKAVIGESASA